MEYNELKAVLRARVQEKMNRAKDYTDEEVEDLVDETILNYEDLHVFTIEARRKLRKELFDSLRRLDLLQTFIEDPTVTEIMVNGVGHIFVERKGQMVEIEERFTTEERLLDVIQQIVAGCNRAVNEASPIVDARLPDGSRVNVVMKPVALNGPILTIRRFPETPITMQQLIQMQSITSEAAEFLEALVKSKYNILISGGTSSGKTTFLNVLSQFIPSEERVITIEDSAELQLLGLTNLVQLETRNSSVEGCQPITIRELIKTSLRMRPERIIVGEVRGSEAADMLQCLNTGHDGSMSTGHANSARDMLSRLENMILMGMEIPLEAIRKQIASGIDIIIHLGRRSNKARKVLEIMEIDGYKNGEIDLHPLFTYEEDNGKEGKLVRKGALLNESKLKAVRIS